MADFPIVRNSAPGVVEGQRPSVKGKGTVGIVVRTERELSPWERGLITQATLLGRAQVEAWGVLGSNRQLAYSTHGVFRFFGKFPPPIPRHLINTLTHEGDWVLDPMTGSGTTAVEALDLGRNAVVRDVSPLSTLLCRAKTTQVPLARSQAALARVAKRYHEGAFSELFVPQDLRDATHWFLPETIDSLGRLREAVQVESNGPLNDLLLTAFVSTVRRVSKATTQQGRLFLDVAKAKADAWPTFVGRFEKYAEAVARLPKRHGGLTLRIERRDVKAKGGRGGFRLAIAHPPYFNNYRYSSVNSLELAWLGVPRKEIRSGEVREAFKAGKPEKVGEYVEDLTAGIDATTDALNPGGVLALMMGDTIIRGEYVPVTQLLLDRLAQCRPDLHLDRVVLRVPQYTEASWVASQRRNGSQVGVSLYDFILLFSRRRALT